MEPDRFKNNHFLYIFGLLSLILSLTLLFFSLYILPYLLWSLKYHVPDVVLYLSALFDDTYDYTTPQAHLLTWLVFFIPSIVFGFISYLVSNRIENQIHHVDTPEEEAGAEPEQNSEEFKEEIKESASIGFKIISLMILIVVVIVLLQVFFQFTS